MKDSDLIYGLMASFHKPSYTFSDLLHLTAPFAMPAAILRTNLARMAAAKLILSERTGRNAYYRFADKGRRIGANVSRAFHTPDWSAWNGAFWGMIFSVPEAHGEQRHSIRKKLTKYRFACMNPGFWIRPALPDENIPEVFTALLTSGYCRLIRFFHHTEFTPEQAETLWNLSVINRDFAAGLSLLQESQRRLASLSPERALVEKMTAGDTVVNILFSDPLLPAAYLPPDWKGDALRDAFLRFDALATERSKPYWEQIYNSREGGA